MKIAHVADLHFSHASYSPLQFLSKRWLGNCNLMFSRKRTFCVQHIDPLPDLFRSLGVDLVLITGDVSTTSLDEEFALSAEFANKCIALGMSVKALPGNHDCYTKASCRTKRFYDFFDPCWGEGNLKEERLSSIDLGEALLIGLDTSCATHLASSQGRFDTALERRLRERLGSISSKVPVFLANHFPFFAQSCSRRNLAGRELLRRVIEEHPCIRMYFQGHTHRHCVADLRGHGLPVILDSGSSSHKTSGTWNLVDYTDKTATVSTYFWSDGTWGVAKEIGITW